MTLIARFRAKIEFVKGQWYSANSRDGKGHAIQEILGGQMPARHYGKTNT